MTIDPTAVLSDGLARLDVLRSEYQAAQQTIESARGEAQAYIDESKAVVDARLAESKKVRDEAVTAAKSEAAQIMEEAKARAASVVGDAKSKADRAFHKVKNSTAEEHSAVTARANEVILTAVQTAEEPRTAYANGIAELVGTGWATTASLSELGHRTPKRPKMLASLGDSDGQVLQGE